MSAHQKGLEAKDSFFVNRERGDYGDFDSSRMLYPQDSTGNDDEDMPGRKEDENGLGEEAGEKERSKFPYDCGRPGRPPDLSFSYVRNIPIRVLCKFGRWMVIGVSSFLCYCRRCLSRTKHIHVNLSKRI